MDCIKSTLHRFAAQREMPGWHSIHKNCFEMDQHLQLNLLTLLRKDAEDIRKVLNPEISKML